MVSFTWTHFRLSKLQKWMFVYSYGLSSQKSYYDHNIKHKMFMRVYEDLIYGIHNNFSLVKCTDILKYYSLYTENIFEIIVNAKSYAKITHYSTNRVCKIKMNLAMDICARFGKTEC